LHDGLIFDLSALIFPAFGAARIAEKLPEKTTPTPRRLVSKAAPCGSEVSLASHGPDFTPPEAPLIRGQSLRASQA